MLQEFFEQTSIRTEQRRTPWLATLHGREPEARFSQRMRARSREAIGWAAGGRSKFRVLGFERVDSSSVRGAHVRRQGTRAPPPGSDGLIASM